MSEFFGFGGYTREPEGFLSWQHLLFVGILLVIMTICAVLLGQKHRGDQAHIVANGKCAEKLAFCGHIAGEQPPVNREKVVIALLDTGVSTTAIQSDSLLKGHNYVTGTDDTEDRINHGTAVASVILGCESA